MLLLAYHHHEVGLPLGALNGGTVQSCWGQSEECSPDFDPRWDVFGRVLS